MKRPKPSIHEEERTIARADNDCRLDGRMPGRRRRRRAGDHPVRRGRHRHLRRQLRGLREQLLRDRHQRDTLPQQHDHIGRKPKY